MKVLLCAIGKCENLYVREWVEHYKKIGFDNICLYDNNDVDGERFEHVIGDYVESGFVILKDVRGLREQQHPCYWKCYHEYGAEYDWIAFFDLDEFLHVDTNDIRTFLAQEKFEPYDCVRVCWKNYTDSGLVRVENNNYSVTRFTEWRKSPRGKSIIRTGLKLKNIKAHSGSPLNACNAGGEKCWNDEIPSYARLGAKKYHYYKHAWLNHYRCKTIEEYVRYKMPRLYPDQSKRSAQEILSLNFFWEHNTWTKEKKEFAKKIFKELGLQEGGYKLY